MRKIQSIAEREGERVTELSSHDRILQAGRELFAGDGYENTTTSAIARKAGTSESQLIKHFGSKEGLLEAIYDHAWQRMAKGLRQVEEAPSSPLDRLRALTDLMIGALEGDKEISTLMLLEGRRIRKHGHQVLLTRGFQQVLGVVDGVLREMRDAGLLRQDLHPEAVRSALIGAFEGLLRDQLLAERAGFPAHYDGAELRAAFKAVLECFLAKPDGSS
ncbi:MAG TPA: helix-turn-helix domain-containing protein [Thermoanaerobaculia bacterium]|jgi:AcrR family transcriptional regulator|nr:helix-turn-helix domain-containing protein [Thermoanaerobaculia bacterium]